MTDQTTKQSKRSAAMRAYWERRKEAEGLVHVHGIREGEDYCFGCGTLLCPDTGKPVAYDGARYWHKDKTACFLHRWINEEDESAADLVYNLRALADGQEDEMGGLLSAAAAKILELSVLAGVELEGDRP